MNEVSPMAVEGKDLVRKALEIYGTLTRIGEETGLHKNTLHRYLKRMTNTPHEAALAKLRRAVNQSVLWDSKRKEQK